MKLLLLQSEVKRRLLVLFSYSAAAFGATALVYLYAPPQVPLWHSLSVSEQQLTNRESLFVIPITMVSISLLHMILGVVSKLDARVQQILFYTTLSIMFLLSIVLFRIVGAVL